MNSRTLVIRNQQRYEKLQPSKTKQTYPDLAIPIILSPIQPQAKVVEKLLSEGQHVTE
jgi:hypothetical protein